MKRPRPIHKHRNSIFGVLFSNDSRRSPKAPQLIGELTLDQVFLDAILRRMGDNDEDTIKLSLGAWRKDAKGTGKIYLTVKAQIPPCIDTFEDETDLHLSGRMLLQDL